MDLKNKDKISRGNFIKGSVGFMAAAMAPSILAQGEHEHHHQHEKKHGKLIAVTSECIIAGESCFNHCIVLVKNKDTSIAECLSTVNEMLVLCEGLRSLASSDSEHLIAYAKVCMDVCKSCAKECKKHAKKHKECKECADLCKQCIKECEKLVA